jgi:hypothetical protein
MGRVGWERRIRLVKKSSGRARRERERRGERGEGDWLYGDGVK